MKETSLRKCVVCRERAVAPAVLPSYTKQLEHDGRKYTVSLVDYQVLQCQRCGAIVLDDAANERLSDGLRAAVGLLNPCEIRQQREALHLTQKALAGFLRISESTLSRWETGGQIQQRAMDALLRVFFQSGEARRILEAPGTGPPSATYSQVKQTG
jgi:putative zinc finger/helix-turn-helix YgiT family protein